jgi:hypothetical protein
LNAREGHYIKNIMCVNKNIAGRTQKEYRDDNKEKLKEYKKNRNKKLVLFYKCDCGQFTNPRLKQKHEKHIKHTSFFNNKNESTQ